MKRIKQLPDAAYAAADAPGGSAPAADPAPAAAESPVVLGGDPAPTPDPVTPAKDPAPVSDKPADEKQDAAKPDDDKAKAEADEKAKAEADAKIPEGEYQFVMPEGIEIDQDIAKIATPILKEAGVTQGEANRFAPLYAKLTAAAAARDQETWAGIQKGWIESGKTDREFGGDKYDASVKAANTAIAKFGSPELVAFFKESGAGNHPEMIRAFAKVGNAFSDDSPMSTVRNKGNVGSLSDPTNMYPND